MNLSVGDMLMQVSVAEIDAPVTNRELQVRILSLTIFFELFGWLLLMESGLADLIAGRREGGHTEQC